MLRAAKIRAIVGEELEVFSDLKPLRFGGVVGIESRLRVLITSMA